MIRLTFLISLLLFSIVGYWTQDLPTLNSSAETSTAEVPATPVLPPTPTDDSKTDPSKTVSSNELPPGQVRSDQVMSDQVIKVATALASRSRYLDAIALTKAIPAGDKNFAKANQLQNKWATAMLALGEAKLQQGKISEAKAILKSIPKSTQAYTKAVNLIRSAS